MKTVSTAHYLGVVLMPAGTNTAIMPMERPTKIRLLGLLKGKFKVKGLAYESLVNNEVCLQCA